MRGIVGPETRNAPQGRVSGAGPQVGIPYAKAHTLGVDHSGFCYDNAATTLSTSEPESTGTGSLPQVRDHTTVRRFTGRTLQFAVFSLTISGIMLSAKLSARSGDLPPFFFASFLLCSWMRNMASFP